ncbi:hypothetical protein IM538_02075 [Cytobacillus suaedae]|nr:hypothetical protein IM538_02075 [Cytobacillus suaedae]
MERFRSFLIFFIPFLLFFIYFTYQKEHNHFSANTSSHVEHDYLEIPEGYEVPLISISVTQDQSDTWLLEVQTKNFRFTPKMIGTKFPSYNEGHAHLYINGKKINRIYGQYYNLGTLKQGKNTIKVTLNSNNHEVLFYNGKPIESINIVEINS